MLPDLGIDELLRLKEISVVVVFPEITPRLQPGPTVMLMAKQRS